MSVRDFQPLPNDVEFASQEFQDWAGKVEDALNIDIHNAAVTLSPSDEVDEFNVAANGRRKITITNLFATMGIYCGTGAPSNGLGSNGNYYFRADGGVATHIYFKSAGAWAGII